jgi:hypothetical protein
VQIGDGAGTDTLQLTGSNAIHDSASVNMASSGVLALGSYSDGIGSLAGGRARA